jgi:hypothetical protein
MKNGVRIFFTDSGMMTPRPVALFLSTLGSVADAIKVKSRFWDAFLGCDDGIAT